MAFSQYLADEILDWVKGGSFPTALSNVFISIHTADPGSAGSAGNATATVTGSASRTGIASSAFTAATNAGGGGRQIANTGVVLITGSAVNVSAQTITHFGVWDAATAGNFLASGVLTSSVAVQSGDTVQFNAGALVIRVV